MAINWFKKKSKNKSQTHEDLSHVVSEEMECSPEERSENVDQAETNAATPSEPAGTTGFFQRLKKGLAKTRQILSTDIDDLFVGRKKLDDDMIEDLEELLITSDIGVAATMDLIERISKKSAEIADATQLKEVLKQEIVALIDFKVPTETADEPSPKVVMVVGVNGVGKTTTIGKIAAKSTASGQKVLIAAADTFRAAASEQLEIWAKRAGADIVKHREFADPAAVAYDSVEAALARGVDLVLVDTAGRIHTKTNLMEELKKIKRSISKKLPEAPHEVLLVLDATTGQNAISQARLFSEAVGVTALALTKLDGTARGGVVVSICSTLEIPLKYVGVGEKIEDLQEFNPECFVDALF
jgi:fused signal recognition particle receptor